MGSRPDQTNLSSEPNPRARSASSNDTIIDPLIPAAWTRRPSQRHGVQQPPDPRARAVVQRMTARIARRSTRRRFRPSRQRFAHVGAGSAGQDRG